MGLAALSMLARPTWSELGDPDMVVRFREHLQALGSPGRGGLSMYQVYRLMRPWCAKVLFMPLRIFATESGTLVGEAMLLVSQQPGGNAFDTDPVPRARLRPRHRRSPRFPACVGARGWGLECSTRPKHSPLRATPTSTATPTHVNNVVLWSTLVRKATTN